MNPVDYSEATFDDLAAGAVDEAGDAAGESAEPLAIDGRDGAGQRLDRYLAQALAALVPGVSRTRIQHWISLGAVWCEQRPLSSATRLLGYESIRVQPLPRDADRAFEPDPVALTIVAEDEHLLVIDKPAGLVMHPAAGNWRGTLLNGLLHHRPALAALPRAGIVHRLDKDTSGCLVVARHDAAHVNLAKQFAGRTLEKVYRALVCGEMPADSGEIRAAIARHPSHRKRMAVTEGSGGREAWTSYRVEERFVESALVSAVLHTGRTHQIRVHFQHIGHPLVGDDTYGSRANVRLEEATGFRAERQMLHAWKLAFAHPITGRRMRFEAPLPEDFQAAVAALRSRTAG